MADKENMNLNEGLSNFADEDSLKEIDFTSFLEENAQGASPLYEGFHEDIEASPAWLERTSDLMVNDEWLEQDYPFQNNAVTESIDFPNVCFDDGADLNTLLIMSP